MTSAAIANCYEMVFHHPSSAERDNEPIRRRDPRVDVAGPLSALSWIEPTDSFSLFGA
jgi:hypothetical protein